MWGPLSVREHQAGVLPGIPGGEPLAVLAGGLGRMRRASAITLVS
jgi:hypothetical protein